MHVHNDKNSRDSHAHHHGITGEKGLLISIVLNAVITIAQFIGGILSGSLALLSDAFHNLSDVFSMGISYIAILVGKKSKNSSKTYGYKRAEILAALLNITTLFAVCAFIIVEAVKRIQDPSPVNILIMSSVAFIGLAGNLVSVLLLYKHAKTNINIKSAFLHLLGDTLSSVAVLITALVMYFGGWYILDPIMSIAIALYIIKESFSVFMQSINILMQATPAHLDKEKIRERIKKETQLGIKAVHHMHIWDITAGSTVFDAHVVVEKERLKDADDIIHAVNRILSEEFKICHSTIQLESEDFDHCTGCGI